MVFDDKWKVCACMYEHELSLCCLCISIQPPQWYGSRWDSLVWLKEEGGGSEYFMFSPSVSCDIHLVLLVSSMKCSSFVCISSAQLQLSGGEP